MPIYTEDGVFLDIGERAYNYYDRKAGVIGAQDAGAWFDFVHDDGTRAYLNGGRICSIAFAIRKGWL